MKVNFTISERESLQVLSVNSLLDDFQNRQILKILRKKISTGNNVLVVDLSELSYINSVGLNFLLMLYKRVKRAGGQILLAQASAKVQQLLDITKLSTVFTITPNVETAVQYHHPVALA